MNLEIKPHEHLYMQVGQPIETLATKLNFVQTHGTFFQTRGDPKLSEDAKYVRLSFGIMCIKLYRFRIFDV